MCNETDDKLIMDVPNQDGSAAIQDCERSMTEERIIIALHETIHAVVAYNLGLPIKTLTIRQGEECCEIDVERVPGTRENLRKMVACSLGPQIFKETFEGSFVDIKAEYRYLLRLCGGDPNSKDQDAEVMDAILRCRDEILTEVSTLLSRASVIEQIEELVVFLLRCETISGKAVEHFLSSIECRPVHEKRPAENQGVSASVPQGILTPCMG